jgi:uracil-DNA glycosylase
VPDPVELLGRYLRQRREMGETELVLESPLTGLVPQTGHRRRSPEPSATPSVHRGLESRPSGGTPAPAPRIVSSVTAPPLMVQMGPLDSLRERVCSCTACALATTRNSVVFGEGDPAARVMIVGEAPGAEEDRTGRPFVGRAGKLLDRFLLSAGLSRADVFICNVLKCRPPENRNPRPDEVEACRGFLRMQMDLVRPDVLLALGNFSAQTLLGTAESIGRLRGRVHDSLGIPLVPTYHPAAVLRSPSWIRPVWEDFQRLRSLLDA